MILILDDIISKIVLALAVLAATLTFFMALCICYSVIGRAYLKQNVAWALELSEYLIYIDVMLATPWVLKIDKHVRVDIFYHFIPFKGQRYLNQIINILGVVMCLWFCYYSVLVAVSAYASGINLVRVIPIKKWLVMVFLPFMSALCAVIFIKRFMVFWKSPGMFSSEDYASFEENLMDPRYSTRQSTELTLPDYDALAEQKAPEGAIIGNSSSANDRCSTQKQGERGVM